MSTCSLSEWSRRVADLHRIVNSLVAEAQGLLPLPAGGTPAERLGILRSLWKEIGVPEPAEQTDPGKLVRDRIRSSLNVDNVKTIAETFVRVTQALNNDIAVALEAGAENTDLIRTCDFSTVKFTTTASSFVPVAFGSLRSLPTGHRLFDMFPADECLQDAGEPVIVLGLAPLTLAGLPSALRYYPLSTAHRLTAARRHQQRQRETEEADQKIRDAAEKADRIKRSQPLQDRIRELEAKVAGLEGKPS